MGVLAALGPALAVPAAACFKPDPPSGLPCSDAGTCPEGQRCGADGLCTDGDEDASVSIDGDTCPDTERVLSFSQRLLADDAELSDNFGQAVASHGEWLVVGVENEDDKGSNAGAAYVFRRDGSQWQQFTKLTATDGTEGDRFGSSVSIHGTAMVVGARTAGDPPAGAAYVFEFDGAAWMPAGSTHRRRRRGQRWLWQLSGRVR